MLHSYSQVFFSNSRFFAILLLIVTFLDVYSGICGFISVLIANLAAYIIGFNRLNIKSGFYGFNALLVGLGIGVFYQPGVEFFIILVFTSLFTLFITVLMEGVIGKYGLPYLSIPFLLVLWAVILATRTFTSLELSERGVFALNEMYSIGGIYMVKVYEWFNNLNIPEAITIYFRSLGAIFFQYHLFPGILISFGILIYSRIAFVLTLIGYFSAYYFYLIIGADISELGYSYIGFNFILTAIAIGGIFLIPSWYSYLWVILLTPLISFTIASTSVFFDIFQLSIYSLPFNIIVLVFLYVLKFREGLKRNPELVLIQHFSPESNLYNRLNYRERFDESAWIPLTLPFWGEWLITQGNDGEYTHKDDWKYALDFEIADENNSTFANRGESLKDYYCYNKPIIAPADGWVEQIQDGIDDNAIGEVNLKQNWGNTIIIKHSEDLYTKMSHLKMDSFKVSKGDFVKKGDILGHCGNSGRSPVPHLHFQVQKDPFIGSKTIFYPLAYYMQIKNREYDLRSYEIPKKGDTVSNIREIPSLTKAFKLVPGRSITLEVTDKSDNSKESINWLVKSDIYNNTYIECQGTGAKAYFKVDEGIHYFTSFTGSRKSILFYYYMAAFKIIFAFYKGLKVKDVMPANIVRPGLFIYLQDFVSPFISFLKVNYVLEYVDMKEDFTESNLTLKSQVSSSLDRKKLRQYNFELYIKNQKLDLFKISSKNKNIEVRWIEN